MERTAVRGRLTWLAAEVVEVIEETPRAHSIVFEVPGWPGHRPGQHVDIRLTAEDGYQAQRSYSIATPTAGERLTLTVELVKDGEVSPYLVEELRIGDLIELRGPIGGYFVWEPALGGPLQLLAGGSGLVPLMAMLRASAAGQESIPLRLLVSARTWEDLLYRAELSTLSDSMTGLEVTLALTRSQPPGFDGYTRRVDREMLEEAAWPAVDDPQIFVCGPTGFVEAVASSLINLGHRSERIKTERFGPSGG
jgi:ferredoxin-NADP reductase